MISREEAIKKLSKAFNRASEYAGDSVVANIPKTAELLVDVYDSIGSCGECVKRQDDGYCDIVSDFVNKKWFCADFERKD